MTQFERVTTQYQPAEDRLRLTGETASGDVQIVWITQRLLKMLLPVLMQWLQAQAGASPHAGILHGFAQQKARAAHEPQPPVRIGDSQRTWLASGVDVTRESGGVKLVFKGPDGEQAQLPLAGKALRQWLNIVHDAYVKAGWPLDIWPDWVRESGVPASGPQAAVLH